jgi:hypothetical protein
MNRFLALGACAIAVGAFGCAAGASADATGNADSELRSELGANEALRCAAPSKHVTVALVPTKEGKGALLSLTPSFDVYALSRSIGALNASGTGITWKGSSASLTLTSDMKGTWESGSQSAAVTCEKVEAAEAASWRTANGLADYAGEIDGLADTVLEESKDPKPKPYTVFVVETSRRGSLSLGNTAAQTAGSISDHSSDDNASLLDQNDWSYGAMSAAYGLGGGDDYGEWFQGISDGVSLVGDIGSALGSTAVAGFIAREKVSALSKPVGTQNPSAVEITVGPWTFFLPDSFAK